MKQTTHIRFAAICIVMSAASSRAQSPAVDITACLGTKVPMDIIQQAPYALITVNSKQVYALVDTGTGIGQLDSEAFSDSARPASNGTKNYLNYSNYDHFVFGVDLGYAPFQEQTFKDVDMGKSGKTQQGLVGTNAFADKRLTIDFTGHVFYISSTPSTFCTDKQLRASGFLPASTLGYFGPLDWKHVDSKFAVNIPTVAVRIDGIPAIAQVDSGYGDYLFGPTININEALYKILVEAGVALKEKVVQPPLKLTKCGNADEKSTPYEVPAGVLFEVLGIDGKPVLTEKSVTLVVKSESDPKDTCGGVGTWKFPAAQIGDTNLINAGRIVIDGAGSKVWFQQSPSVQHN